jgi:hypothetical protein
MERGTKTTSDSYVLWPSRIGAFSLVLGRHYHHSNTTDFPFSYLIEERDESHLIPGINLRSIGTIRDSQKWPLRDRRKDPNLLDLINFNLLSPYTVQKMINGREILIGLRKASGESAPFYSYHGMVIKNNALKRGISLYEKAIWKFLGNSLITRLKRGNINSPEDIQLLLQKDTPLGSQCQWIDLAGMICPSDVLEKLLNAIENDEIHSLEEINASMRSIHGNYYSYEWSWAADVLEEFYGKAISDLGPADIIEVTRKWMNAVLEIDKYLYEDALKEFTLIKQTEFGANGERKEHPLDFENVRDEFETHTEVHAIREHMAKKEELGKGVISLMERLLQFEHVKN